MKTYVHARLNPDDRRLLQELKQLTGRSDSELVREGLHMARAGLRLAPSALTLAGASAGKFAGGPKDLSTNQRHLDGFGR